MLKEYELINYIEKDNYTISEIVKNSNYTRAQVVYACKKYGLKPRTDKKRFNVDVKKVKALYDAGFKVSEIAQILKVNNRCIYNIMYRNMWTVKRTYPKARKQREVSNFGYKFGLGNIVTVVCKNGTKYTYTLRTLIDEESDFISEIKYLVIKK